MKIAVVYNRESRNVINLFGTPNRERYGLRTIRRIMDALKKGGYKTVALEGDKDLIDKLQSFMPSALKGERPGMVFNLSYGIQGQARYTHVPSILEMVGIPYVGSGPLAHSLALDKVVAKMIFRQSGLPTPDFAVLYGPGFEQPELEYPLIVKAKNEAVSMGLTIVENEEELREAADYIFREFHQPALVERFIEGKEINVGLIGNDPPEALTPAEIDFGSSGPPIYTYEDKTKRSGREIHPVCPARISPQTASEAKELALRAFSALGCYDCARVDMRIDAAGNIYILEVNSLPSLGEHGSYTAAAEHDGLDYDALVKRLIEVASARYFGTPSPTPVAVEKKEPESLVLGYLTQRRDQIEKSLGRWVGVSSRTADPVGIEAVVKRLGDFFDEMGMTPVRELSEKRATWAWETKKGFEGGILLVAHLDVPLDPSTPAERFRVDPEWLYGEGVGCSRAPLVMMEYALRSLRAHRLLRRVPLGVLFYTDEGSGCRYSAGTISGAMARAGRTIVLRPANPGGRLVTQRRGQRRYRLLVEGKPQPLGKLSKEPEPLSWIFSTMKKLSAISSRKERLAVSPVDIRVDGFPMMLPHKAWVSILASYPDVRTADRTEKKIRSILVNTGLRLELSVVSDRPPMQKKQGTLRLARKLKGIASRWDIPLDYESSVWPSVAGLAPEGASVVCGAGPVARDVYTAQEAVQRISLIQRTLLLAQFLAGEIVEEKKRGKSRKTASG
ncbi:MAG: ATP-grasp domain-containing protein [Candidatus Nitrospinota bacterium M3_3B_026]